VSARLGPLFLALAVSAVLLVAPSTPGQAGALTVQPTADLIGSAVAFARGDLANLTLVDGALTLGTDASFVREGRVFGYVHSAVEAVEQPFDRVRLLEAPAGLADGTIEIDVRSSADAVRWSAWTPLSADAMASVPTGYFLQYRAELSAPLGHPAELQPIGLQLASTGAAPVAGSDDNPTVKLFGTREGLVGRRTANGHLIAERDHFVALPSKRVLNADGKRDYQVRLGYKGRSVTVPIWDIGPWNTRDNYWDEKRDLFTDLPRFQPQAFAAWKANYNNGRDQFGRWVSFPASIDIADGTYLDDLGMKNSDWVDVTFLWVDAPSPAKSETPVVSGLKPENKDLPPLALAASIPEMYAWYFAEGSTLPPFETYFVLFNPGNESTSAVMTFMSPEGNVSKQEYSVGGGQRVTVQASDVVPGGEFSVRIDSTLPLVAERSMYFGGDGHSTVGAAAPATTWYLAEGSTQRPFDTWFLVQNPGGSAASLVITLMKDNGENQVLRRTVPPTSRASLHLNELAPDTAFGAKIVADQPVVVERTTYLAGGGGHNTLAAPGVSNTWYLAEGQVKDGQIDTWILIQNPGRTPSSATVTVYRENGKTADQRYTIGGAARLAVNAKDIVGRGRFGIKVDADQPVVVERAMYFGGSRDGSGTGAHASTGSTTLAKSWLLPDGGTMSPYKTQLLVANPGGEPADLSVTYVVEGGKRIKRDYEVGETSRLTIDVNSEVPDSAMSILLTADRPVVMERSVYFYNSGGTNSLGVPR
jgi:hypothetical protein